MKNLCSYCVAYIDSSFFVFVFWLCTHPIWGYSGLCSNCVCVRFLWLVCCQLTYSPTVDLPPIGGCQRWDIKLNCRIGALQSVRLVQLLHNVFYFPRSDSSSIWGVKCVRHKKCSSVGKANKLRQALILIEGLSFRVTYLNSMPLNYFVTFKINLRKLWISLE